MGPQTDAAAAEDERFAGGGVGLGAHRERREATALAARARIVLCILGFNGFNDVSRRARCAPRVSLRRGAHSGASRHETFCTRARLCAETTAQMRVCPRLDQARAASSAAAATAAAAAGSQVCLMNATLLKAGHECRNLGSSPAASSRRCRRARCCVRVGPAASTSSTAPAARARRLLRRAHRNGGVHRGLGGRRFRHVRARLAAAGRC